MTSAVPLANSATNRTAPAPLLMSPWVPATRVGSRPRQMLSGARVFAALATLLVLARRGSEQPGARID